MGRIYEQQEVMPQGMQEIRQDMTLFQCIHLDMDNISPKDCRQKGTGSRMYKRTPKPCNRKKCDFNVGCNQYSS